jgi:dTDP-glucose 4,6-dehydratase
VSRVLVTGAAGFLGSHLCDHLLARGDEVIGVDNFASGAPANLTAASSRPAFRFLEADVCAGLDVEGPLDAVAHLASPASPTVYARLPLETLRVGSSGTDAALALAHRHGARFLLASTSEVYGDPLVHPQHEDYWVNVNPVGPRSCYDEAKRYAEALTAAWRRAHGANTGIVRIFNTYGPRLGAGDGRVVSTFVSQALAGRPLTVHGDGTQTRSLCYVDDLVRGLLAMLGSDLPGPFNLGNPAELTVRELAATVLRMTGSSSEVIHRPLPEDDPARRRPDIARARAQLDWEPQVLLREGLARTIAWFREAAAAQADSAATASVPNSVDSSCAAR